MNDIRSNGTDPLITESQLVARLKAGDSGAYEAMYRAHAGAMLGVARRYFGDTADAGEAVQDALVAAFRGMPGFAGTARLGTWLYRVTANACLMRLRSRRRDRLVPLTADGAADEPSSSTDPDANLTRAEDAARVRAGVARLPGAYREVIRLRDFEGLDTTEAAARLGVGEGVVKTRLHRARAALRVVLEAEVRP